MAALAHGNSDIEQRFRERAIELGVAERVMQIPFLPHWRVPEFLRGCLAVCCLEQDFPIGFHNPIIPREVLLSGACLVGSCEVITKLPHWEQLADGYNCVAIKDVNDVDALAERLGAIVRDPHPAIAVGKRGRDFALELEEGIDFPDQIERVLTDVAEKRVSTKGFSAVSEAGRFPLTQIAAATTARSTRTDANGKPKMATIDLQYARKVLAKVERAIAGGKTELHALKKGVEVEIAIAAAEEEADEQNGAGCPDPIFRLQGRRWAFEEDEFSDLVPVRNLQLRIVEFDFDVAELRDVRTAGDLPSVTTPGASYIAVFGNSAGRRRDPLVIDAFTARVLEHCDGMRTVGEIVKALQNRNVTTPGENDLKWIEHLFVRDLIHLHAKSVGLIRRTATTRRDHKVVPT